MIISRCIHVAANGIISFLLWLFLWHIYGISSVSLRWNLEISLHPFQPSHPSLLISNFLPSSSVQFSRSDVSDSLWPQGLQHARPPCPSPIPGVYSHSCSSSWWCYSAISSSVILFSSCLQSFPTSGSLPVSQLFASTSVLPMNTQDWSPLGWTGWISLQSKGFSRVFNTTVQKHQFFGTQLSLWSNSHVHTWLLEKPQLWVDGPLSGK